MNKKSIISMVILFLLGTTCGILGSQTLQGIVSKDKDDSIQKEKKVEKKGEKKDSEPSKDEDINLPKQSYSQVELDSLSKVSSDFIKAYYTTTSDRSKESLEAAKEFMTDDLKNELKPYNETTDNEIVIETKPYSLQNYVQFDSTLGEAKVMGFAVLQTRMGTNEVNAVKTIIHLEMKKNNKNNWLVSNVTMVIANQDLPPTYYQ